MIEITYHIYSPNSRHKSGSDLICSVSVPGVKRMNWRYVRYDIILDSVDAWHHHGPYPGWFRVAHRVDGRVMFATDTQHAPMKEWDGSLHAH